MRIAYIALHLEEFYMRSGVGRKIESQLQIWNDLGHEAHLFLHTPDEFEFPLTTMFRYQPPSSSRVFKPILREKARSRVLGKMMAAVQHYQPDIIFLRYGLFAVPLHRLFKIAPVVVEINTDDVNEYRHRGGFYYWINRLTRSLILGRSSGLTPVSGEIAALPFNTRYSKPTLVVSNGIDTHNFDALPAPANERPHVSFVVSPGRDWHGVDKLVRLAHLLPDFHFDVIGYQADAVDYSIPENVIFHGFLDQIVVREILKRSDIACGTLALHRKQMEEASPLKVRESMTYGIPTVIAYEDTDLSGRGFETILQIPNTEDNVTAQVDSIRDFAYQMIGIRVDRDQVLPLIDQKVKEKARLQFFGSFIGSDR